MAHYRASPAFSWSCCCSLPPDKSSVTECFAALGERGESNTGLLIPYQRPNLGTFGGEVQLHSEWVASLWKPGKCRAVWWASSFHVQSLNPVVTFRISLNKQILPIFCFSKCQSDEALFAIEMLYCRLTLWIYSGIYNWICSHVWMKQVLPEFATVDSGK